MRTVNRRELNQQSGKILDEVLDTGEPVEVVTRGRGSVIITPKPQSLYEQWKAQGLVIPAASTESLADVPGTHSSSTVQEILDDIRGDRLDDIRGDQ